MATFICCIHPWRFFFFFFCIVFWVSRDNNMLSWRGILIKTMLWWWWWWRRWWVCGWVGVISAVTCVYHAPFCCVCCCPCAHWSRIFSLSSRNAAWEWSIFSTLDKNEDFFLFPQLIERGRLIPSYTAMIAGEQIKKKDVCERGWRGVLRCCCRESKEAFSWSRSIFRVRGYYFFLIILKRFFIFFSFLFAYYCRSVMSDHAAS